MYLSMAYRASISRPPPVLSRRLVPTTSAACASGEKASTKNGYRYFSSAPRHTHFDNDGGPRCTCLYPRYNRFDLKDLEKWAANYPLVRLLGNLEKVEYQRKVGWYYDQFSGEWFQQGPPPAQAMSKLRPSVDDFDVDYRRF